MIIRKVQPEDNPKIAKMIREVFVEFNAPKEGTVYSDSSTDHLYETFQKQNSCLLVAEEENEIVGSCGIFPTPNLPDGCIELVKFYVSKSVRGTGVGRQLMMRCEERAKTLGFNQIYIESAPAFNKAIGIYTKNGYTLLDQPLGTTGHFGCNVWLLKNLKNQSY